MFSDEILYYLNLKRFCHKVAGLPTYSDLPLFTPIFDRVTADSDFRDCTPIFEISSIGFDIDRIFVVIASKLPLAIRYEPAVFGVISLLYSLPTDHYRLP